MSYRPIPPKSVSYGNRVLRVLLGIGGGLIFTNAGDVSTPTRLNQRREAKEQKVRGQNKLM